MVQHITSIIQVYQERLNQMRYVPRTSFRQALVGHSGDKNKNFLTFLFSDQVTGIQFLKDVGLILSKVQCNPCGHDMTWYAELSIPDGFRWRCRRRVAGKRCSGSRSIRHGLWSQQSRLTHREILYLTYDIMRHEPANQIQYEHHFSDHTIADWDMFCGETLLVYLEGSSEKIGSPNKKVEIDESKFGLRKYHKGHPVRGQWVFDEVECGSGRTFLVPVPDRTVNTLKNVTHAWLKPGTTLISDFWAAYRDIESQGYTYRTVNHSISFVKPETTLIPSRVPGVTLKLFSDITIGGRTTSTTSLITCSRQSEGHKCRCSLNFLTSPHLSTVFLSSPRTG